MDESGTRGALGLLGLRRQLTLQFGYGCEPKFTGLFVATFTLRNFEFVLRLFQLSLGFFNRIQPLAL